MFVKLRILCVLCLLLGGTVSCMRRGPHFETPTRRADQRVELTTTGYCACKKCCGWKRNWLGKPVYAYGASKGKPKKVGITSTGSRAQPGVAAVDPRLFPYGSIFLVPGYGWVRAEDRGGAIKGKHIDLFFETHEEALEWGRRSKPVLVWYKR